MKNERKKNIIFIIAAVAFCIVFSRSIYNSVKYYKYRRLCDQYRESLITATNENRELADRIGRIEEITGRIKETANANVTDTKGIIELIEMLRSQIKELEDYCGGFDYNKYYEYWDSYYHDEQLME